MKTVAKIVSYICLLLTLVPSFLVFMGEITLETNKNLMLAGTIGWFISAPFWMNKKEEEEDKTTA